MATWNDLPFEIKSHILLKLIQSGIETEFRLRGSTENGPSMYEELWKCSIPLHNLLEVAPDLRSEAEKIADRMEWEWRAIVADAEEERKKKGMCEGHPQGYMCSAIDPELVMRRDIVVFLAVKLDCYAWWSRRLEDVSIARRPDLDQAATRQSAADSLPTYEQEQAHGRAHHGKVNHAKSAIAGQLEGWMKTCRGSVLKMLR